jgi:gas vesicle protein
MNNSQNQNWKFGFGLLAGALVGYWLNSDKGRRVRTEIQNNASVYGEQAAEYVKHQADTISETANKYYEQGKEVIDTAATAVKHTFAKQVDQVADEAEQVVEATETKVKSGIDRARRNIKNSAENLA